jgi:beta-mannosidase
MRRLPSISSGINQDALPRKADIFMKRNSLPAQPRPVGDWRFLHRGRWRSAASPGCIHTDLLRHGLIGDPFYGAREKELHWIGEQDWSYRSEVRWPRTDGPLELVAHGLDTIAEVRLDGRLLGRTANMFRRHAWDVRDAADGKAHRLDIVFRSIFPEIRRRSRLHDFAGREWCDPVGGASTVRKSQCNFGWDWGPRMVTCGLFRPVELQTWDGNRIRHVQVAQRHRRGVVDIALRPELEVPDPRARFRCTLSWRGRVVATSDDLTLRVRDPRLWWPSGHGAQPLYDLTVELLDGADTVSVWSRRLGLRTIDLERQPDRFGESFRFAVNGRPLFAKGANWIPAHVFPHGLGRADYEPLLRSAAAANMNMIRCWGGGIYEHESFYDLCDELGLLVWQDFMFACALYPGDRAFLDSVAVEAEQQVKRLQHRACLALWCGSNEIEQMPGEIVKTAKRKKAHLDLFYGVLPRAVEQHDGRTAYWPSSPHNPEGFEKGHNNERAGDAHLWDVWHSLAPVKKYETQHHRFVSEFGMQSFPHPEVAAQFCPPRDCNILAPSFEAHQKNGGGNATILHYTGKLFRFPRDYDALAYLSQLNQAHCMRVAVEHFRRSMPRTMGTLYWQLNDCWPAASWSSLDHGGRWKALQHEARRFYAPVLLSPVVLGEETLHTTSNTVRHDYRGIAWHVVADEVMAGPAELVWTLHRVEGGVVRRGRKKFRLRPDAATRVATCDLRRELADCGIDRVVVAGEIRRGARVLARATALFVPPRLLPLRKSPVRLDCRRAGIGRWKITLRANTYHHRVELSLPGAQAFWTDNFFDLLPGVPRTVELSGVDKAKAADIRVRSLVDTAGH